MANFCEIDSTTNEVKRVCIVDNNIETSDGPLGENDKHADGIAWCNNFWGTYNSWIRNDYTTLDTLDWLPPEGFVPESGQKYTVGEDTFWWEFNWDEDLVAWKGSKADDPSDDNYYKYNFTNNIWEVIN